MDITFYLIQFIGLFDTVMSQQKSHRRQMQSQIVMILVHIVIIMATTR